MKQYEYSDDSKSSLIKDVISALGEFVGTTFFVFLGISSVNSAYESMYARNAQEIQNIAAVSNATIAHNGDAPKSGLDPASQIQVAFGFGFGLMCMVWAFFRISGGHLNPAVTLGLFCSGAVPPIKAVLYIIGQCCGAMLGALFSKAIYPTPTEGPFRGANGISDDKSRTAGFFLELILTFLLVFVVHMLALEVNNARNVAPFVIGTIVFVGHLVAIPITGTSMNPARSFGASVVTGEWDDHWIFWVAPLCGGILASVFYRIFSFFNIQALNGNQDHTTAMDENRAIAINSTESLPH